MSEPLRLVQVGAGGMGRAWLRNLAADPDVTELLALPGNPGIATTARCVAGDPTDVAAVVALALAEGVGLVVVGPEAPLVAGVADALVEAGVPCFGPSTAAARLEGSKSFTKALCDAASIPTARWERFTDPDEASMFVRRRGAPVVVKADGLAFGKGVFVTETETDADAAIPADEDPAEKAGATGCDPGPDAEFEGLLTDADRVPADQLDADKKEPV